MQILGEENAKEGKEMKIALVVDYVLPADGVYNTVRPVEVFMERVCGKLRAEFVVVSLCPTSAYTVEQPWYKIPEANVDVVMIDARPEDTKRRGVRLAESLLRDGIESLLVGGESFDLSEDYPLWSVPGPPDQRCEEDWYVESVAKDLLNGPLTHSGAVEYVLEKLTTAEAEVKKAEMGLVAANAQKYNAEQFRDTYLGTLVKIRKRREKRLQLS